MDTTRERAAEPGQYLTFRIAGEEHAIGILKVREIIEYEEVTRVPATPPWIRGVLNLRGSVVPAIDLAVKLGLPASPVTRRTCIVIAEVDFEGEPTVMGVIADSVSQVVDLAAEDIEPPPGFGTRVHTDYLLGMGKTGKKLALLLDVDRILSAAEILQVSALEDAATEEAPA